MRINSPRASLRHRFGRLAVLALGLGGCALASPPAAPPEVVTPPPEVTLPPPLEAFQAFDGTVFVGGQQLPLVVELRGTGPSDAIASLHIPDLPLEAHGRATVRQDRLTMDLRYEGTCAGEARIEAQIESGGRRASGTLRATDCTGQESGTIVLMRRSP